VLDYDRKPLEKKPAFKVVGRNRRNFMVQIADKNTHGSPTFEDQRLKNVCLLQIGIFSRFPASCQLSRCTGRSRGGVHVGSSQCARDVIIIIIKSTIIKWQIKSKPRMSAAMSRSIITCINMICCWALYISVAAIFRWIVSQVCWTT